MSRFILNHSDPPGTRRDHSGFDVTYSNKRGVNESRAGPARISYPISPREKLNSRLGIERETLQMRSLCWQPVFTAVTGVVMTDISAEMHVCCSADFRLVN